MPTVTQLAVALATLLATLTAHADIKVTFVESAPKDSFIIKNIGACNLVELELEIDLGASLGKLIFDTTDTGAGVEVFQPFEIKTGTLKLVSANAVNDGDKSLTVSVATLSTNDSVSFTIDVDDTLPKSALGQIRVTGSEIQGAEVRLNGKSAQPVVATFSNEGSAHITLPPCT